jgi:hypothetical protein
MSESKAIPKACLVSSTFFILVVGVQNKAKHSFPQYE